MMMTFCLLCFLSTLDHLFQVKGMITDFGEDMHCQFLEIIRILIDSYTMSGTQVCLYYLFIIELCMILSFLFMVLLCAVISLLKRLIEWLP